LSGLRRLLASIGTPTNLTTDGLHADPAGVVPVVLVDHDLDTADLDVLSTHLRHGGRAVVPSRRGAAAVGSLLDPTAIDPDAHVRTLAARSVRSARARPAPVGPRTRPARRIELRGRRSRRPADRGGHAVASVDDHAVVAEVTVGLGTLVVIGSLGRSRTGGSRRRTMRPS
jgi:hypothetical protein